MSAYDIDSIYLPISRDEAAAIQSLLLSFRELYPFIDLDAGAELPAPPRLSEGASSDARPYKRARLSKGGRGERSEDQEELVRPGRRARDSSHLEGEDSVGDEQPIPEIEPSGSITRFPRGGSDASPTPVASRPEPPVTSPRKPSKPTRRNVTPPAAMSPESRAEPNKGDREGGAERDQAAAPDVKSNPLEKEMANFVSKFVKYTDMEAASVDLLREHTEANERYALFLQHLEKERPTVRKRFGGRWYAGQLDGVHELIGGQLGFHVQYEDGDKEHQYEEEFLQRLKTEDKSLGKEMRQLRRTRRATERAIRSWVKDAEKVIDRVSVQIRSLEGRISLQRLSLLSDESGATAESLTRMSKQLTQLKSQVRKCRELLGRVTADARAVAVESLLRPHSVNSRGARRHREKVSSFELPTSDGAASAASPPNTAAEEEAPQRRVRRRSSVMSSDSDSSSSGGSKRRRVAPPGVSQYLRRTPLSLCDLQGVSAPPPIAAPEQLLLCDSTSAILEPQITGGAEGGDELAACPAPTAAVLACGPGDLASSEAAVRQRQVQPRPASKSAARFGLGRPKDYIGDSGNVGALQHAPMQSKNATPSVHLAGNSERPSEMSFSPLPLNEKRADDGMDLESSSDDSPSSLARNGSALPASENGNLVVDVVLDSKETDAAHADSGENGATSDLTRGDIEWAKKLDDLRRRYIAARQRGQSTPPVDNAAIPSSTTHTRAIDQPPDASESFLPTPTSAPAPPPGLQPPGNNVVAHSGVALSEACRASGAIHRQPSEPRGDLAPWRCFWFLDFPKSAAKIRVIYKPAGKKLIDRSGPDSLLTWWKARESELSTETRNADAHNAPGTLRSTGVETNDALPKQPDQMGLILRGPPQFEFLTELRSSESGIVLAAYGRSSPRFLRQIKASGSITFDFVALVHGAVEPGLHHQGTRGQVDASESERLQPSPSGDFIVYARIAQFSRSGGGETDSRQEAADHGARSIFTLIWGRYYYSSTSDASKSPAEQKAQELLEKHASKDVPSGGRLCVFFHVQAIHIASSGNRHLSTDFKRDWHCPLPRHLFRTLTANYRTLKVWNNLAWIGVSTHHRLPLYGTTTPPALSRVNTPPPSSNDDSGSSLIRAAGPLPMTDRERLDSHGFYVTVLDKIMNPSQNVLVPHKRSLWNSDSRKWTCTETRPTHSVKIPCLRVKSGTRDWIDWYELDFPQVNRCLRRGEARDNELSGRDDGDGPCPDTTTLPPRGAATTPLTSKEPMLLCPECSIEPELPEAMLYGLYVPLPRIVGRTRQPSSLREGLNATAPSRHCGTCSRDICPRKAEDGGSVGGRHNAALAPGMPPVAMPDLISFQHFDYSPEELTVEMRIVLKQYGMST